MLYNSRPVIARRCSPRVVNSGRGARWFIEVRGRPGTCACGSDAAVLGAFVPRSLRDDGALPRKKTAEGPDGRPVGHQGGNEALPIGG